GRHRHHRRARPDPGRGGHGRPRAADAEAELALRAGRFRRPRGAGLRLLHRRGDDPLRILPQPAGGGLRALAGPGPAGGGLRLLLRGALVAVAAVVCLFAPRLSPLRRQPWASVAIAGVLLAVALGVELTAGAQLRTLFQGGFTQDRFALFAKAVLLATTLVVVLAAPWAELGRPALGLTLLACFGGLVSASATDLAGLWAGLELAVLVSVAALAVREP